MIERSRIERAARIYKTNVAAAQALGIAPQSFHRLCKHYGIPTPRARKKQAYQDQQAQPTRPRPAPVYQIHKKNPQS